LSQGNTSGRGLLQIAEQAWLRGAHARLQIAKTGLEQVHHVRGALTTQLRARLDAVDARISAAIGQDQASTAYDVGTVGGPAPTGTTPPPAGVPVPAGPPPAGGLPAPIPPPPAAGPAPVPLPPVAAPAPVGTIPPSAMPAPSVTKPPPGNTTVAISAGTTHYTIEGVFANPGPNGTLVQAFRTDASGQILTTSVLAGSSEVVIGDPNWEISVAIAPGKNYLAFIATDYATGAYSAASPLITILPPPATPTLKDLEAGGTEDATNFTVTGATDPNTTVQVFPASDGKKTRSRPLATDTVGGDKTDFSLEFKVEDRPRQLLLSSVNAYGKESLPLVVPLISIGERSERKEKVRTRKKEGSR